MNYLNPQERNIRSNPTQPMKAVLNHDLVISDVLVVSDKNILTRRTMQVAHLKKKKKISTAVNRKQAG